MIDSLELSTLIRHIVAINDDVEKIIYNAKLQHDRLEQILRHLKEVQKRAAIS